LDVGCRLGDSVLIAGVGRSGTTWLADLINFDGCYRDLFEPFHPWMVPAAAPLLGSWYQRAGDAPPPAFADYVGRVLRGRVRHAWIDRFNRRALARGRLVKAIRANLFLGWLSAEYPQVKIILLIRHPAAVARSRLALPAGWEWRPTLAELLEQRTLREQLSPAQWRLVADAQGSFDEYLLTWSISHRLPLAALQPDSVLPVFYERLRSEPEAQLRRVFAFIGRPWDAACLHAHGAPSKTARRMNKDANMHGVREAPWLAWLSTPQRERMHAVLDAFEVSWLYDGGGMPARADDELIPNPTDALR
jgi:hypothetical protein